MSQAGIVSVSASGGGTVSSFSFTDANGFDGTVTNPTTTPNLTLATSVGDYQTLYAQAGALTGGAVGVLGEVWTSNGPGVAPSFQAIVSGGYSPAKIVVSPTVGEGDYTTLAAAVAGATAGDIIFVKEGSYSETLTIDKRLSFVALTTGASQDSASAAFPPVAFLNCQFTLDLVEYVSFQGIFFENGSIATDYGPSNTCFRQCTICQTSGNPFATATTGFAGDIGIQFDDCELYALNGAATLATGFKYVQVTNCSVPATVLVGGNLFDQSIIMPSGNFTRLYISNSLMCCNFTLPSSFGFCRIYNSNIQTVASSPAMFTTSAIFFAAYNSSFTADAGSIADGPGGANILGYNCRFQANTDIATGGCIAGGQGCVFDTLAQVSGGSSIQATGVGIFGNLSRGSVPPTISVGSIGYVTSTSVDSASAVSVANNTDTTIMSITLNDLGEYWISGLMMIKGALTGTYATAGVSTTDDDLTGTQIGLDANQTAFLSTATADQGIPIPGFKVVVFAPITYYFVVRIGYTVGTATAYGSLNAELL